MKTREEIEVELETIDGLLLGATSDSESEALEAYQDALAWVLGQREESPSQKES
jgi:hypothetical protein